MGVLKLTLIQGLSGVAAFPEMAHLIYVVAASIAAHVSVFRVWG